MILPIEEIPSRIKYLYRKNFKNLSDFAKACGIPYTTLDCIIKRGSIPTLKNLYKICACLNIEMADFLKSYEPHVFVLDETSREIIKMYDLLPERKKELLVSYLRGLLE